MKKRAKRRDYLNPINLDDDLWLYVEAGKLCIVSRHHDVTKVFNIAWRRLDRLREQIPKRSLERKRTG